MATAWFANRICPEILSILDQFFLSPRIDDSDDRACVDQSEDDAAHAFNQRVRAL
jgi:hypothetical protein